MAWDTEHGCERPGRIGSAEHVGEPLTVDQIKALEAGTRIVVTWAGGNGPHEYGVIIATGTVCVDSPHRDPLLNWPDPLRSADGKRMIPAQKQPLNRVTLASSEQEGT